MPRPNEPVPADVAVRYLRELPKTWRQAKGGKGPGMMEQLKRRPGKDLTENLHNALYLLAKEPGSVSYMEMVLAAAHKLELIEVAKWIAGILMDLAVGMGDLVRKEIVLDLVGRGHLAPAGGAGPR